MLRRLSVIIFIATVYLNSFCQADLLRSGPMVGFSEMSEVMLWVQTTVEARVRIEYWNGTVSRSTATVLTKKEEAFTAHLLADSVAPGNVYNYSLYINEQKVEREYPLKFRTQEFWQYRKDPPAFRFAAGSCTYVTEEGFDRPGDPFGEAYYIFKSIRGKDPEFMIWLGDNVYLRDPDLYTRTGILHRYTHTRSIPEMQALLGSVHHYATWDDHDFGPDDSDRGYPAKEISAEAFRLFWANNGYGISGGGGIDGYFRWADCDFFLLDNRTFRAPDERTTGERTMLGELQLEWLIDALSTSSAPFKFVCIGGQVLNDAEKFETYHHYFSEERKRILDAIASENIKGVVFLSGDKHHSELNVYKPEGAKNPVYELTASPLTSRAFPIGEEINSFRMEGTGYEDRNFALLEVSGGRKERSLQVQVVDRFGVVVWTRTIGPDYQISE